MVKFDADITDPPSVDSSNPFGTAINWAGYVIVAALMFIGLGYAQNEIAPMIANLLPGNSGEETFQIGTNGGGL